VPLGLTTFMLCRRPSERVRDVDRRAICSATFNYMADRWDEHALLVDVTLIVVGYNCTAADLDRMNGLAPHFDCAIFVDNGPQAHTMSSNLWQVIVSAENVGFAAAANRGALAANTPFIFFLNPDVCADIQTIRNLVTVLRSEAGLAGIGPSLAPDNTIFETNAGGARKSLTNALVFAFAPSRCLAHRQIWRSVFPASEVVSIDWLSGACLLFRRHAFLRIGGFPTDYFLYDEDVALGCSAQSLGYRLGVLGATNVYHRVGGTQCGSIHFRRWAASNQRHVQLTSASGPRAVIILVLICIGLLRRSLWRSFIGQPRPYRYAGLEWTRFRGHLMAFVVWMRKDGVYVAINTSVSGGVQA
jgi:N-acetylglucosaminyl-diphospho-decaprenol L-rhamnosyltransferase